MTAPSLSKKSYDCAIESAPESAAGADFYYGDSQGKGNAHYDNTNESFADTQTNIAIATSTAVPSVTQVPKETESPAVSSTAAAIAPDSPAKTEQSVRTSTNSVTVYTSLIVTNTKSEDDISALIDAVFSYDEPKTERTDEFSVKVVFSTPIGKFTYFVTEDDVSGIVPTGDLSGDSGTNTQAPVTSTAATPYQPSVPTTTAAPPTTTVPQIYPEQEKGTANYIKSYASSASVYTKEIAKNTKAPDEIHFLVDKAFAKEDTTKEKDDIHTVKVVFTVGSEKYTFFLTEEDVADIVP